MHHQFGSKFLIDILYKLGFSSSYSEVQKFELNAAATNEMQVDGITFEHMIQFVADNVDHNLRTIDGHNTFHGMGIIATITPCIKRQNKVHRATVSIEEVTALAKIDIRFHKLNNNPLTSLSFERITVVDGTDFSWKLDLLSNIAWPLRSPRLGLSAMMQIVHDGSFPGHSDVIFLPMIDMNPIDISCIYSTFQFIGKEPKRHGAHPIVTFDQPLYWKALMITCIEQPDSEIGSIILRLGGFHMEMSFLGCIGYLMRGSGLVELLETVYASTAVGHMLSGKAVARAVRAHFLVHTVLNAVLFSNVFGIQLPNVVEKNKDAAYNYETRVNASLHTNSTVDVKQNNLSTADSCPSTSQLSDATLDKDLLKTVEMFDLLLGGDITAEYVCKQDNFDRIREKVATYRQSLSKFRASSIWLQYLDMVDIL